MTADKVSYPAILRKTPDSDWGVEFPDVPGCISAGKTREEALVAAQEALQGHLECWMNSASRSRNHTRSKSRLSSGMRSMRSCTAT